MPKTERSNPFVQLWGVCLPLHTKQQVSGTETGEEQVIGWHVFRAQKMFPFWGNKKKKGRWDSWLYLSCSRMCTAVGEACALYGFLQVSLSASPYRVEQHRWSPNSSAVTVFSKELTDFEQEHKKILQAVCLMSWIHYVYGCHRSSKTSGKAKCHHTDQNNNNNGGLMFLLNDCQTCSSKNKRQPALTPDKCHRKLWPSARMRKTPT